MIPMRPGQRSSQVLPSKIPFLFALRSSRHQIALILLAIVRVFSIGRSKTTSAAERPTPCGPNYLPLHAGLTSPLLTLPSTSSHTGSTSLSVPWELPECCIRYVLPDVLLLTLFASPISQPPHTLVSSYPIIPLSIVPGPSVVSPTLVSGPTHPSDAFLRPGRCLGPGFLPHVSSRSAPATYTHSHHPPVTNDASPNHHGLCLLRIVLTLFLPAEQSLIALFLSG